MNGFWEGFHKHAVNILKSSKGVVGLGSKGGKIPIPGLRTHSSSPNIIPGQGAVTVSKGMNIKSITQSSKGVPGSAV